MFFPDPPLPNEYFNEYLLLNVFLLSYSVRISYSFAFQHKCLRSLGGTEDFREGLVIIWGSLTLGECN
jgi:hypothetical protein